MPALDETVALSLIEQGSRLAPLDRALLLVTTLGDVQPEEAAHLPLDQRDRQLIDARIAAFGPTIGFFSRCPHCNEGNEAGFDLRTLPAAVADTQVMARVGDSNLTLRAPTSASIASAVRTGNTALLLEHCVDEEKAGASDPAEVEAALARAFPLLDVRFQMSCSACAENFDTRFDIVPWLWREIEALALRAIHAVDRLARAYGWSERDILALSPSRRDLYLARIGA